MFSYIDRVHDRQEAVPVFLALVQNEYQSYRFRKRLLSCGDSVSEGLSGNSKLKNKEEDAGEEKNHEAK